MATITTNTFLDGGTARTAGEAFTLNPGGTLTVRTDSRWHANAPASMTGAIGAITINNAGGSLVIDGTAVRWLAFTAGADFVPAIGTAITQGGVSGYLLGVWVDAASAPSAPAAAMPVSGFIKLREVAGGQYVAGALTGITATASGADVVGWIEVVREQSTLMQAQPYAGLIATGSWFSLGTTSGAIGQTFQVPTNGGGAGTAVYGVQIETAPGSGVYEWYPASRTANFVNTLLGTGVESKFVESVTANGGQIRIGQNSSAVTVGYLPASGCSVRIPNIFLRQCTAAARATNITPTNTTVRPAFGTTTGVYQDMTRVHSDWAPISINAKVTTVVDCVIEGSLSSTKPIGTISVTGSLLLNSLNASGSLPPIEFINNHFTATVNSCKTASVQAGAGISVNTSDSVTVSNAIVLVPASTMGGSLINVTSSSSCTFTNIKTGGGGVYISASSYVTVTGHDYSAILAFASTASGASPVLSIAASQYVTYSGLTQGLDRQSYAGYFAVTGDCTGTVISDCGTATTPLNSGSSSSTYPAHILNCTSTAIGVSVKRVYVTNVRIAPIATSSSMINCNIESISAPSFASWGLNLKEGGLYKGISTSNFSSAVGNAGHAGFHFSDVVNSGSGIFLFLAGSLPNANSTVTTSIAGSVKYSNTALFLPAVGDYVIVETPYQVRGHTGFQNVAPTISASNPANILVQYDLDTGSGYSGVWKTASAANLFPSVVSQTGFKMKLKVSCTVANATNNIAYVTIPTTATLTTLTANPYPLSAVALGFTSLKTGSEVRVYSGTNPSTSVEIGGVESTAGSTFSFTHSSAGAAGVIAIFALGYQPIYLPYTFKSTDDSILIQQVVDRNYVNPV